MTVRRSAPSCPRRTPLLRRARNGAISPSGARPSARPAPKTAFPLRIIPRSARPMPTSGQPDGIHVRPEFYPYWAANLILAGWTALQKRRMRQMKQKTILLELLRWLCAGLAVVFLVVSFRQEPVSSAAFEDVASAVTAERRPECPAGGQRADVKRLYGLNPSDFDGCLLYYPQTTWRPRSCCCSSCAIRRSRRLSAPPWRPGSKRRRPASTATAWSSMTC